MSAEQEATPSNTEAEDMPSADEQESVDAPVYTLPPKKTIEELAKLDEGDESLRKWKESLGIFDGAKVAATTADGRRLIPISLRFIVEGREDIVILCSTPEECKASSEKVFVIKEGTEFTFMLTARIQNEIVYRLRYEQVVKRGIITVDKHTKIIGTFGPKAEDHEWEVNKNMAPTGMTGRGTYSVTSKLIDDDHPNEPHLEFTWKMKVASDWK